MSKSKQNRKIGDIVQIELSDGYCYGRVLKEPLFGFYDFLSKQEASADTVVGKEMAFKVWVSNYAVKSGRWKVVGESNLSDELKKSVPFFKQDLISGKISIYEDGKERVADKYECENLERAAVWDPEHIENRLEDYFKGVENKWVKSMKMK